MNGWKQESTEQMHFYKVKYQDVGKKTEEIETIEAHDPGGAFARCQKSHPGSVMIECWRESLKGWAHGFQAWTPPKIQRDPIREPRPARALKPKEKGCEFPFYNECNSTKPL